MRPCVAGTTAQVTAVSGEVFIKLPKGAEGLGQGLDASYARAAQEGADQRASSPIKGVATVPIGSAGRHRARASIDAQDGRRSSTRRVRSTGSAAGALRRGHAVAIRQARQAQGRARSKKPTTGPRSARPPAEAARGRAPRAARVRPIKGVVRTLSADGEGQLPHDRRAASTIDGRRQLVDRLRPLQRHADRGRARQGDRPRHEAQDATSRCAPGRATSPARGCSPSALTSNSRPADRGRWSTSSRSSRTTMSAGAPITRRPRSGRPATRAGTSPAARSASTSGTPSACRSAPHRARQGASGQHAVAAPRDPVAHGDLARPHGYVPSPRPAAAIESLTSATPGRGVFQTSRTISSSRCRPSTISCTITSARASAAPTTPGSRGRSGRIALKRCVTVRTPRSNARAACALVGVRVPERGDDAVRAETIDQFERPGQLGRERHVRDRPCRHEPFEQMGVGIAAPLR